ncbi:MAG: hypothetical protein GVY08_03410 [Bacteroidetes bacterium]|nr:hypothetical protein [Bacteroidota bacterium]
MYLNRIFPLLLMTLFVISCTNNSTSTDPSDDTETPAGPAVTSITIDNVGATAYIFIGIDGDGASANLNEQNAELELKTGERFSFKNEAGASNHPLDFRNSDREKLLGQSNGDGLFDNNEEVDLKKDANTITFTLTAELAGAINDYICHFHPGMNANIVVAE